MKKTTCRVRQWRKIRNAISVDRGSIPQPLTAYTCKKTGGLIYARLDRAGNLYKNAENVVVGQHAGSVTDASEGLRAKGTATAIDGPAAKVMLPCLMGWVMICSSELHYDTCTC
jgi:hypothetical protein